MDASPVVGESFAVVRVRPARGYRWLQGRLRGTVDAKPLKEEPTAKPAPRLGIVRHAKLLRGLLRGKARAAV